MILCPVLSLSCGNISASVRSTVTTPSQIAQRVLDVRGSTRDEAVLDVSALHSPVGGAGYPAMRDFTTALDILAAAHYDNTSVVVFGDFDVDGMTSSAIAYLGLGAMGYDVDVVLASRKDSARGLTTDAVDKVVLRCFPDGVKNSPVLLVLDCGTSNVAAVRYARDLGFQVVVVDHHNAPEGDPTRHPATALVNPRRGDCHYPYKDLCSAGLTFYLIAALKTKLGVDSFVFDPLSLVDFAAVGTIADVVSLRGDNRAIVRAGLRKLALNPAPGFNAILQSGAYPIAAGTQVKARDVSMQVAPVLNAPARVDRPEPAFRLLVARNGDVSTHLDVCLEQNRIRKEFTEAAMLVATAQAETLVAKYPNSLIVCATDLPAGVLGIVASRLSETYGVPSLVATHGSADDAVQASGSARSVRLAAGAAGPALDVYAALQDCQDLLSNFGGHAGAAGFSLHVGLVDRFRSRFDAAVAAQKLRRLDGVVAKIRDLGAKGVYPKMTPVETESTFLPPPDGSLRLADCTEALVAALDALEPYGQGFPEPVFAVTGRVESSRVLRDKHLSLLLSESGSKTQVKAIWFNAPASVLTCVVRGDTVDLHVAVDVNEYRGARSVQLRVVTGERRPA